MMLFILVWESLTGIIPVRLFRSCGLRGPGVQLELRRLVCMSVTQMRFRPPSYFTHISITTPIVSAALEKILYIELSRSPNEFF
jgi:hypothetical protein